MQNISGKIKYSIENLKDSLETDTDTGTTENSACFEYFEKTIICIHIYYYSDLVVF